MKEKLKIIISNYDDIHNPYYSGGGAYAMHEIGRRLAKRHDVTIVAGAYPGSKDQDIDGIHYIHIGIAIGGPLVGQLLFAVNLPFAVQRFDFDVWFENFVPPHSTNMLPLFTRKPVIGITSLLDAKKFSEKYHFPFYLIEEKGLAIYKYIIALSPALENRVRKKNKKGEVRVIPDGISSDYLKLQTSEKNYVYFLGRLDIFQKGLDMLLEAWKIVTKKYPDIKLLLAGEGTPHDHSKLLSKVVELGLIDTVIFTGRIEGKQKKDVMRESLAAVFPSRFESFGIAPLEALAVGKPMVCFDIEGFSWIDPDVCVKVTSRDSRSLAQALQKVLDEKKLRLSLGKKARSFARPYTWENITNEYEQFVLDVSEKNV